MSEAHSSPKGENAKVSLRDSQPATHNLHFTTFACLKIVRNVSRQERAQKFTGVKRADVVAAAVAPCQSQTNLTWPLESWRRRPPGNLTAAPPGLR